MMILKWAHGTPHAYVQATTGHRSIRGAKGSDMATTIHYIHNTESSQQHGDFGEQYGQHVEPHGRYISEVPANFDHGRLDDRWEHGSVTFHNPKHMDFGGGYAEPDNWKHRLSAEYGGKAGRELSDALRADGHDGIITHDKYGTSEIVDLTHPKPARRRKASVAGPLYHGTSRDLTSVEPADRHGQGEMSTGLTRTDRAYATHDPQMARSYAEMSGIDTGRRPRVYQVEHSGPAHDLEPDPGYDADVRTPHSFRVLREVPEHELIGMPRHTAQELPRCPCGIPVEYDPSDGWQHVDGSISHDGDLHRYSVSDLMDLGRLPLTKEDLRERTAGKGKPRQDAPDVARRADQAGQGPSGGLAPDSGRDGDGGESSAPLRALAEHPKVSRDLAKLPRNVQAAYHERMDALRRGEAHPSTHALTGPLKGWQATHLNFLNRVVHRYDGDELRVLSAGNHDESYDQGARRLGRYTAPRERLFGPTFGLDTRLFDEDQRLRDSVRMDVITRFDVFCHRHGYEGWHRWAKVVFFGSEASEWTSKTREGNGDFDLSIGIHYPALRATVPGFEELPDEAIAAGFTQEMHAELNDPHHRFPGVPGEFDQTWFQNQLGWDIRRIRPYAAYDVVDDEWIVRPPHLEDWSLQAFPEGPGAAEEVRGIIEMAEGILKMPEPYRTQNGSALWEFVHGNRSDAFGPQGEGWWDMRNLVDKALDQKGLMQKLWECHDRAEKDPQTLASPGDWSNSPVHAR